MINEPYFPDLGVFVSMLIRDIPAAQSVTVVDHFYAVCLRNLIDKTEGPESRVLGSGFILHAAIISGLACFYLSAFYDRSFYGVSFWGPGVYHKMPINHLIEPRNELAVRFGWAVCQKKAEN